MTTGYRDIKAQIQRSILGGDWAPGAAIPAETDLAAEWGVARATVNRALRELADEGLIERKRKSGSRVRLAPVRQARFDIPLVRREIESRGATYRLHLIERAETSAPDWLAARLGLDRLTPVLHLVCLHHADATPWQFEDRWINLNLLPEARDVDFSQTGPNEWLVARVPFTDVEIDVTAMAAGPALATHLACAPGDPLLTIERATRWHGRPVTFVRLSHQPGHRMTTQY